MERKQLAHGQYKVLLNPLLREGSTSPEVATAGCSNLGISCGRAVDSIHKPAAQKQDQTAAQCSRALPQHDHCRCTAGLAEIVVGWLWAYTDTARPTDGLQNNVEFQKVQMPSSKCHLWRLYVQFIAIASCCRSAGVQDQPTSSTSQQLNRLITLTGCQEVRAEVVSASSLLANFIRLPMQYHKALVI